MLSIETSGGPQSKNALMDQILNLIGTTKEQLNVVTPKIDKFFMLELQKLTKKGVPILLITSDRHLIPKPYQEYYDALKSTQGISLINNPNVRFLLVFNSEKAVYSGGALDKEELEKSVLIVTTLKEQAKLRKIAEIFTQMLPTFMRK